MIAQVFDALGDPIRLEMVRRLSQLGPLPTGKLTEGLGLTRQGAERHLRHLERAGLVKTLKIGRVSMREIDLAQLVSANRWISERAQAWEQGLRRLEASYRDSPE